MHDSGKVTRGRAITNRLAKVLGPAQVGNYVEPRRPVTDAQQASAEQIRSGYRRVVAPDGTVRLERA